MRNYAGLCKGICSYNLQYKFFNITFAITKFSFLVLFSNAFWYGNELFPKVSSKNEIVLSLSSFICYIANIGVWKYVFACVVINIKIFHSCRTGVVFLFNFLTQTIQIIIYYWRQRSYWYVQFYCYHAIIPKINATCDEYVLQSLQRLSLGTQFLISALNAFSVSKFLIFFGRMSHIFGPKRRLIPYHILLSLLFVYLRNCSLYVDAISFHETFI